MCLWAKSSGSERMPNTLFRKKTRGARIDGNAKQRTIQIQVYCHKLLSTSFDIAPTVVADGAGALVASAGRLGKGFKDWHEDKDQNSNKINAIEIICNAFSLRLVIRRILSRQRKWVGALVLALR